MRNPHIWVVVADGVHARILAPDRDLGSLVPVGRRALGSAEGRLPARDLKSDAPGRSFSSARNGMRHAIEPQHDHHKMEKHKFVVELAETLDRAVEDNEFRNLIIAAPKRSLGELRKELSERVKARIREEIPKDLVGIGPDELWERIAPSVRKVIAHAQMG